MSEVSSPSSRVFVRGPGRRVREVAGVGSEANEELIAAARASRALRPEFTAADLHPLVVDNALALKHGKRPPREDYDRRTTYLLDGIRGRLR